MAVIQKPVLGGSGSVFARPTYDPKTLTLTSISGEKMSVMPEDVPKSAVIIGQTIQKPTLKTTDRTFLKGGVYDPSTMVYMKEGKGYSVRPELVPKEITRRKLTVKELKIPRRIVGKIKRSVLDKTRTEPQFFKYDISGLPVGSDQRKFYEKVNIEEEKRYQDYIKKQRDMRFIKEADFDKKELKLTRDTSKIEDQDVKISSKFIPEFEKEKPKLDETVKITKGLKTVFVNEPKKMLFPELAKKQKFKTKQYIELPTGERVPVSEFKKQDIRRTTLGKAYFLSKDVSRGVIDFGKIITFGGVKGTTKLTSAFMNLGYEDTRYYTDTGKEYKGNIASKEDYPELGIKKGDLIISKGKYNLNVLKGNKRNFYNTGLLVKIADDTAKNIGLNIERYKMYSTPEYFAEQESRKKAIEKDIKAREELFLFGKPTGLTVYSKGIQRLQKATQPQVGVGEGALKDKDIQTASMLYGLTLGVPAIQKAALASKFKSIQEAGLYIPKAIDVAFTAQGTKEFLKDPTAYRFGQEFGFALLPATVRATPKVLKEIPGVVRSNIIFAVSDIKKPGVPTIPGEPGGLSEKFIRDNVGKTIEVARSTDKPFKSYKPKDPKDFAKWAVKAEMDTFASQYITTDKIPFDFVVPKIKGIYQSAENFILNEGRFIGKTEIDKAVVFDNKNLIDKFYKEFKNNNGNISKNLTLEIGRAMQKQANKLNKPIVFEAPARHVGSWELELAMIYPKNKVKGIKIPVGLSEKGTLVYQRYRNPLTFNPIKEISKNIISKIEQPKKEAELWSRFIKYKRSVLTDPKKNLIDFEKYFSTEFGGKHGLRHITVVEPRKFSHDLAKLYEKDIYAEATRDHGYMVYSAWKKGYLNDMKIEPYYFLKNGIKKTATKFGDLPYQLQKEIMISERFHSVYRPTKTIVTNVFKGEPFMGSIKAKFYEKVLGFEDIAIKSTRDRLDLIRYGLPADMSYLSEKYVKFIKDNLISSSFYKYERSGKNPYLEENLSGLERFSAKELSKGLIGLEINKDLLSKGLNTDDYIESFLKEYFKKKDTMQKTYDVKIMQDLIKFNNPKELNKFFSSKEELFYKKFDVKRKDVDTRVFKNGDFKIDKSKYKYLKSETIELKDKKIKQKIPKDYNYWVDKKVSKSINNTFNKSYYNKKYLDNISGYNLNYKIVSYKPAYKPVYKPVYKPAYKPTYKPAYKPAYKPVYKPAYKPVYKPAYKPVYKPAYKPTYKPTYKPAYKPVYKTFYKIKDITDKTKKKRRLNIPEIEGMAKKKVNPLKVAYDVEVYKDRAKWVKVNRVTEPTMNKFAAIARGIKETSKSPARSFRVVKSETTRPAEVVRRRVPKSLKQKYYSGKKSRIKALKNAYIEKPKYAIDSPQEARSITKVGWETNRSLKRKRRITKSQNKSFLNRLNKLI